MKLSINLKLIGSKMEHDFRQELIRSNVGLNKQKSNLGKTLEKEGFNILNAFVLHWTAEQLEDIFVVFVDGSFLISVEIDKYDSSKKLIIERIDLNDYLHGLSKMNQVRLAVALDLVKKSNE
jgi:hypothetical protein